MSSPDLHKPESLPSLGATAPSRQHLNAWVTQVLADKSSTTDLTMVNVLLEFDARLTVLEQAKLPPHP